MDAMFDQALHLLKLTMDQDPDQITLKELLNSGLYSDLINALRSDRPVDRAALRRSLCLPPSESVTIEVNYNSDLFSLVEAGDYEFVSDEFRRGEHNGEIVSNVKDMSEWETSGGINLGRMTRAFELVPCQRRLDFTTPAYSLDTLLFRDKLRPASPKEFLAFNVAMSYVTSRFGIFTYRPSNCPCGDATKATGIDAIAVYPNQKNRRVLRYLGQTNLRIFDFKFSYILATKR